MLGKFIIDSMTLTQENHVDIYELLYILLVSIFFLFFLGKLIRCMNTTWVKKLPNQDDQINKRYRNIVASKIGQSRETSNIWYTRHRTKTSKTMSNTNQQKPGVNLDAHGGLAVPSSYMTSPKLLL
jgi:hypothetical protein